MKGPSARVPPVAALTRMSYGAKDSKSADSAARSRTSHSAAVTPLGSGPARSGLRLTTVTNAPLAASCSALARPMTFRRIRLPFCLRVPWCDCPLLVRCWRVPVRVNFTSPGRPLSRLYFSSPTATLGHAPHSITGVSVQSSAKLICPRTGAARRPILKVLRSEMRLVWI